MNRNAGWLCVWVLLGTVRAAGAPVWPDAGSLCDLWGGETKMVNGLWIENPGEMKFGEGRSTVTVADIQGPAVITMIHFAWPAQPRPGRDVVIRIYWDGETQPSVESPLYDFFCDPNGALERVDTALVNKRRGWNCYFPMPFRKSARIELSNDRCGVWDVNPCYSYVTYRTLRKCPKDLGYFHAHWRQQALLMGKDDYEVFTASGRGQFIGWNVTIRGAGAPNTGYPVDENEKFYIDGEAAPSIEWQGIEDSFGFSWGFPESANSFPLTGYQPYYTTGAAAYRFCMNDRISFKKSMRFTVGFGEHEHPMFREQFSKPENPLEFSSVAYWYQTEPHQPFPPLPTAQERRPRFIGDGRAADPAKYEQAGETVALTCGNKDGDTEYLKSGWDFTFKNGFMYQGWPGEINHCWASEKAIEFDLVCPKGAAGTLRLFLLDGDNFKGGRKESVAVAGRAVGDYENFQQGQWVEVPISSADTAEGRIPVRIQNLKPEANAVVSLIQFIEKR